MRGALYNDGGRFHHAPFKVQLLNDNCRLCDLVLTVVRSARASRRPDNGVSQRRSSCCSAMCGSGFVSRVCSARYSSM
jgi:hypothetical protein